MSLIVFNLNICLILLKEINTGILKKKQWHFIGTTLGIDNVCSGVIFVDWVSCLWLHYFVLMASVLILLWASSKLWFTPIGENEKNAENMYVSNTRNFRKTWKERKICVIKAYTWQTVTDLPIKKHCCCKNNKNQWLKMIRR